MAGLSEGQLLPPPFSLCSVAPELVTFMKVRKTKGE